MARQSDEDNAAYVREVHDKGLAFDLGTMNRRRMLAFLGGAGVVALAGGSLLGGATTAQAADCVEEVESETAGPFPADGSNGPDVRTEDGVVRADITKSFGASSGVADGVPLEFSLVVQDLNCAPLAGAAVYVWHCDRAGLYSLYSAGATEENYLRGIQVTDATGKVTFKSIFPACYTGRWPHIHFEVYTSLEEATSGAGPIRKTSQIAFPEEIADAVYETEGYEDSITNMGNISLATDMVFADDLAAREMATVTGDVTTGYVATLTITVDPAGEETGGGGPGGPGGPPPSGTRPPRPTPSGSAPAPTTTPSDPTPSDSPSDPAPSDSPSA